MTDSFYLSTRWQRLRKMVIVRAKYKDQLRIREGVSVEADTVHHIFPRDMYPEYQWERWNLIAISGRTHKLLHTPIGGLSQAGQRLLEETAAAQGIPTSKMILIVGEPGSGKTSCAKQELKGGIAYDLDYLAAAFRLRGPHEERHTASRRLANQIAKAFAAEARHYTGRAIMIRTAPSIEEVAEIDPDEIIVCRHKGSGRKSMPTDEEMEDIKDRISEIEKYADANGITLKRYPPQGEE